MIELLILGFLIYFNSRLAVLRGRASFVWGMLTLVAYFVAETVVATFYIMLMYRGALTPLAMRDYILNLQHDTMKVITLTLIGIGGALLVRFILEKLPPLNTKSNSPDTDA